MSLPPFMLVYWPESPSSSTLFSPPHPHPPPPPPPLPHPHPPHFPPHVPLLGNSGLGDINPFVSFFQLGLRQCAVGYHTQSSFDWCPVLQLNSTREREVCKDCDIGNFEGLASLNIFEGTDVVIPMLARLWVQPPAFALRITLVICLFWNVEPELLLAI